MSQRAKVPGARQQGIDVKRMAQHAKKVLDKIESEERKRKFREEKIRYLSFISRVHRTRKEGTAGSHSTDSSASSSSTQRPIYLVALDNRFDEEQSNLREQRIKLNNKAACANSQKDREQAQIDGAVLEAHEKQLTEFKERIVQLNHQTSEIMDRYLNPPNLAYRLACGTVTPPPNADDKESARIGGMSIDQLVSEAAVQNEAWKRLDQDLKEVAEFLLRFDGTNRPAPTSFNLNPAIVAYLSNKVKHQESVLKEPHAFDPEIIESLKE